MKLHEVLESGKKFRRKSWGIDRYMYFKKEYQTLVCEEGRHGTNFGIHEILADDWEIIEQKIELTENQILDTIEYFQNAGMLVEHNISIFIKELGFDNE